jgi:hypothetical protein
VDLHGAGPASNVRRDCRALLNNLPAERVLFAFARPPREDYLFRLINPGIMESGQRFTATQPAVEVTASRCRANRERVTGDRTRPNDRTTTSIVSRCLVSGCDRRNMHR